MEIITQEKNPTIKRRVIRVVLTGGISAGKSSILNILREQITDIPTAFVSECATELLETGYTPERFGLTAFQHTVFRRQLEKERAAVRALLQQTDRDTVPGLLICDRGLCDCGAYVSPESFATICESFSFSRHRLLNRYQVVLFLETAAALTDIPFDTGRGNRYRLETDRKQAMVVHENTWQVWADHPNVIRIPACDTFDEKQKRTAEALKTALKPWYDDRLLRL